MNVTAWDAYEGDYGGETEKVSVLNTDIIRPQRQVTGDTEQVRRAGPVIVKFNEDVTGLTPDRPRSARASTAASRRRTTPLLAGTWSCATAAGAAVDCAAGPVRTATFVPAVAMTAGLRHWVVINPEHVLGVTDLPGNPATYGFGGWFRTL